MAENQPVFIPGYGLRHNRNNLTCLKARGNYTVIELGGRHQPLMVCQPLKYFETRLPDFIRVHKSLLLNPSCVVGIEQWNPQILHLHLANGSRTLVARRRVSAVIRKLDQR